MEDFFKHAKKLGMTLQPSFCCLSIISDVLLQQLFMNKFSHMVFGLCQTDIIVRDGFAIIQGFFAHYYILPYTLNGIQIICLTERLMIIFMLNFVHAVRNIRAIFCRKKSFQQMLLYRSNGQCSANCIRGCT